MLSLRGLYFPNPDSTASTGSQLIFNMRGLSSSRVVGNLGATVITEATRSRSVGIRERRGSGHWNGQAGGSTGEIIGNEEHDVWSEWDDLEDEEPQYSDDPFKLGMKQAFGVEQPEGPSQRGNASNTDVNPVEGTEAERALP